MPRTTFVFRVLDNVSDLFVSSADVLSILSLSVMFVYFVPFWFSFRALSLVDTEDKTKQSNENRLVSLVCRSLYRRSVVRVGSVVIWSIHCYCHFESECPGKTICVID